MRKTAVYRPRRLLSEASDSEGDTSSTGSWSTLDSDEDGDDDRVGVWHYAVAVGRALGIFSDWAAVRRLTRGHAGALFKKFAEREDAERFLHLRGVYESLAEDADWYYAVAVGRRPGIYTHFSDAKMETSGFPRFRMKKFERFWQAEAFLSRFGMALMTRCAVEDEHGRRHWVAREHSRRSEDPKSPRSLVAFCHASVLRNGGNDPCAAAACIFPHARHRDLVGPLVSPPFASNRAELLAAVMALEFANEQDPEQRRTLFVFTHSQLLVRTMRRWVWMWRDNGWLTAAGDHVKNQDVIQRLVDLQGERDVQWRHVLARPREVQTWEAHWSAEADHQAHRTARVSDEMRRKVARISE